MLIYVSSFYWAEQELDRFAGGHMKMMSQLVTEGVSDELQELPELLFVTKNSNQIIILYILLQLQGGEGINSEL